MCPRLNGTLSSYLERLDSAMPLLKQNISANKPHFPDVHLDAAVLDWDSPLPDFIEEFPQGFDAIV